MQRGHQRVTAAFDVHHEETIRRVGFDLGPQDFSVGVGDPDVLNVLIAYPLQLAFVHGHRGDFIWINGSSGFVDKDQPVVGVLVRSLTDHSEQMDFIFLEHNAGFFMNLTHRTGVRRFPVFDFKFSTDGGVHACIGLFGAVEQESSPLPIGEMHQNRDAVRDTGVINGGVLIGPSL